MYIYGAGMAGLLAGQMLRRHAPQIREAQGGLPDNHGALLRFRTRAVEEATGIRFREVNVLKAIKRDDDALATVCGMDDANQYSLKVTGSIMTRSVLDLRPVTRYIAPDTFISDLTIGANVSCNLALTRERIFEHRERGEPIISTIPMPALMNIVEWPQEDRPQFAYRQIWTLPIILKDPPVNVYQTIYYPSPGVPYYRASITGNRLMIEFLINPTEDNVSHMQTVASVLNDFGLPFTMEHEALPVKAQQYGKLLPVDERQRKAFILAMSDTYGIYSVGRFATWRQILLDDVVNDISIVGGFITERNSYSRALKFRR
jgi:hypothetical protein